MRREAGLTLVELLVTIAVLGVLLGVGVPAFGSLTQDSRLTTATNRLVAALHLTRSEAVRRNGRVTLCNSADGLFCATGGGWEQGWIVFVDTGGTGQRAEDDPLLAVGDATADGLVISGNTPVQRYVSYVGLGSTRRANGSLQMGTITVCAGDAGRQVVISRTGRVRVQQGGCEA
jgi:type IV fimbrial biogenesis protein FimT